MPTRGHLRRSDISGCDWTVCVGQAGSRGAHASRTEPNKGTGLVDRPSAPPTRGSSECVQQSDRGSSVGLSQLPNALPLIN